MELSIIPLHLPFSLFPMLGVAIIAHAKKVIILLLQSCAPILCLLMFVSLVSMCLPSCQIVPRYVAFLCCIGIKQKGQVVPKATAKLGARRLRAVRLCLGCPLQVSRTVKAQPYRQIPVGMQRLVGESNRGLM